MTPPPASLGLGRARPVAALLIGALHLAALAYAVPVGQAMGIPEPVSVMLEREDLPAEAAPTAVEAAVEAPPPVAPPTPPEIVAPDLRPQEKAEVVVPPVKRAPKITPPKAVPPKITPPKREVAARAVEPRPKAQREAQQRPAARAAPGEGRAQANAGRAGAAGNSAAYAARVRATLQSRASALGFEDVNASVGLSFVIGPSGSVTSASLSRPSGDFKVDGALRRMLASSSFPPPPGGHFSGAVTVRIH
jgi:periplasmic protein TonB